jgi:hypothetical protein
MSFQDIDPITRRIGGWHPSSSGSLRLVNRSFGRSVSLPTGKQLLDEAFIRFQDDVRLEWKLIQANPEFDTVVSKALAKLIVSEDHPITDVHWIYELKGSSQDYLNRLVYILNKKCGKLCGAEVSLISPLEYEQIERRGFTTLHKYLYDIVMSLELWTDLRRHRWSAAVCDFLFNYVFKLPAPALREWMAETKPITTLDWSHRKIAVYNMMFLRHLGSIDLKKFIEHASGRQKEAIKRHFVSLLEFGRSNSLADIEDILSVEEALLLL